MADSNKRTVKKEKKSIAEGRLYINASFNNTLATITDPEGNVFQWTSCGRMGFKGTRRSTPFAATSTLEDIIKRAIDIGIKRLKVYVSGPGPGRDAALRVLRGARSIDVTMISDITPIPHNGPRPPKRRRG
ncbi:MAG: 30S ribosomal protein S11 [Patescibacteria group bacterium]|nr:30S ribosomal protein S11 [Patescibacteria group bacterium]